jgi:hypothetical protein
MLEMPFARTFKRATSLSQYSLMPRTNVFSFLSLDTHLDFFLLFPSSSFFLVSDGLVLIEDLHSGGSFAAQPSTFHLNKNEKRKQRTLLPDVLIQDNPTEDFRTNVELNMMGI